MWTAVGWKNRDMAKTAGAPKKVAVVTRLPIKDKTMRELMFASGGRCAMTDCGLPLISASGGWIGTVAHIVGAEPGGPRGKSGKTPEQRREFQNLVLMCATHGREVDAPETGEKRFPVAMLEAIKKKHEAKISKAVKNAIKEDVSGERDAAGLLDTGLRPAQSSIDAAGLGEAMGFHAPAEADKIDRLQASLGEAKSCLQRLSRPGLEGLCQILKIWVINCRDDRTGDYGWGDYTSGRATLPYEAVANRVGRTRDDDFDAVLRELKAFDLIEVSVDEYAHTAEYVLRSPWSFSSGNGRYGYLYDFWGAAADFLWAGHSVMVDEWALGLDFSIFDRVAAADRDVPWR